jgi:hypothetical protein
VLLLLVGPVLLVLLVLLRLLRLLMRRLLRQRIKRLLKLVNKDYRVRGQQQVVYQARRAYNLLGPASFGPIWSNRTAASNPMFPKIAEYAAKNPRLMPSRGLAPWVQL